jgi:hypothetical protein
MTRVRHVTPGPTAARIERMRTLITALQIKSLTRDEMAGVLQMGPSGVRKYLVDLAGKYEWAPGEGEDVCRLTINDAEARTILATMAASAQPRPARPAKTALSIAVQDPARRFHIMQDDEHFTIKPLRGIPPHEPVLAAFFGRVQMEARV